MVRRCRRRNLWPRYLRRSTVISTTSVATSTQSNMVFSSTQIPFVTNRALTFILYILTFDDMATHSPLKMKTYPESTLQNRVSTAIPPIFDYGVALTWSQLVEFAAKKGINEKADPDANYPTLHCDIEDYLNQKCGLKSSSFEACHIRRRGSFSCVLACG
ncbi:hypothetical protein PM082_019935 [Marasmius tenuissimus]|nr:hypothetical protein PM082_019935 [Marasmius tenuissimus]